MKTNNKFDSAFRKRARDIKIDPSDNVWNSIEHELTARKRSLNMYILSVAAGLILLIGFYGLMTLQQSKTDISEYHVHIFDNEADKSYEHALLKWVTSSHKINSSIPPEI